MKLIVQTACSMMLLSNMALAEEYVVMVDFEGDDQPERVTIDPDYDLTDALYDCGRVSIERENDIGGYTTYVLYGSNIEDSLGGEFYSVHGIIKEKLRVSVADGSCSAWIYWDGVWDTLPYSITYVGC